MTDPASNPVSDPELKPCPFCGESAELDTHQAYRAVDSGRIGTAVAVYCTRCSAQQSLCLADVPNMRADEVTDYVVGLWNGRKQPPETPDEPVRLTEWQALVLERDRLHERCELLLRENAVYSERLQKFHHDSGCPSAKDMPRGSWVCTCPTPTTSDDPCPLCVGTGAPPDPGTLDHCPACASEKTGAQL